MYMTVLEHLYRGCIVLYYHRDNDVFLYIVVFLVQLGNQEQFLPSPGYIHFPLVPSTYYTSFTCVLLDKNFYCIIVIYGLLLCVLTDNCSAIMHYTCSQPQF